MRNFRLAPAASIALAAVLLVGLTACDPGAAAPTPTGSSAPTSTPVASATPTPTATEDGVEAAKVVATSSRISVFATDGSTLAALDYTGDPSAVASALAEALGVSPATSSTTGEDTGCDADQQIWDFGGLVLRSPGHVGSVGALEVEITSATTGGGIPIETVAGQRIGAARGAFEAAIGDDVLVGDYPPSAYLGYDVVNPADAEFDHIGTLARFDGGSLAQLNMPHYLYGDC